MLRASILEAELLKMRKRWLPYVLLIVLVLGAALTIWGLGLGSWYDERDSPDYNFGESAIRTFVFPWSLVTLLDVGQFYGAVIVSVLFASAVATEYGWGTVRQAIVRGQTRAGYLTAKLIGVTAIAAVMLLITLAAGLLFSAVATAVADEPSLETGDPSVLELLLMVLRAGYAIIPYALLAFMLAVVGRSTTIGIVGTFLYIFLLEPIAVAILASVPDPGPHFQNLFPGHHAASLLAANRLSDEEYYSFAFREAPLGSDLPDPFLSALALAAFCAAFLFIAYYVFQRRDLTIESGGN
jgi:ABC-type transport system involved in multi-copper enzyme maturation permease subunit